MKVCHIITGLDVGGAEIALSRLLSSNSNDACVFSLTTIGKIGKDIESMGYEVFSLNLTVINFPVVFFRLWRNIKLYNPTIVQTWLYHADFLGGLAAKLAGVPKIIWGVRTTKLKKGSLITLIIRKLCSYLSYWVPTSIVVVAEAAKKEHIKIGYDAKKMIVIHNGFRIERTCVNKKGITNLNKLLPISENDFVIGCIGRLSQVKGQDIFIKAAGIVLKQHPYIKFLMVGRGLSNDNQFVVDLIRQHANIDNFVLADEREDISDMLQLMNIFCLPSRSEGFPNALVEAMLSGTPCVSTNAGDAQLIGGGNVPIARTNDSRDLSKKIILMIEKTNIERERIALLLQKRAISNYSISKMCDSYSKLYQKTQSDDRL